MKKSYHIIVISLALILSGCYFSEDDIFSESSADRINRALSDYHQLLLDNESGWVMQYFPTDTAAGFNFVMKFDSVNKVEITAKNIYTANKLLSINSLFELIADNGPVLTFNSYNDLFHLFSNPEDPDGFGKRGDYEFIVLNADNDLFQMKGKKRGTYINMFSLAPGTQPNDFFLELEKMDTVLFVNSVVNLFLLSGNDTIATMYKGTSHQARMLPYGGDIVSDLQLYGFILTKEGFRFHTPYNVNGIKAQSFILNENKDALISKENSDIRFVAMNSMDCFFNLIENRKSLAMINNVNSMSSGIKEIYERIKSATESKGRVLSHVALTKNATYGHSLSIKTSKGANTAEGFLGFNFIRNSASEITLTFNGFSGNYDPNGKAYYDGYDGVSDLVNFLNSKFTVSYPGNGINPSLIRLTNVNNPDIWFDLNIK